MRISDWSSDVCSSDLLVREACRAFPDRVVLGIDARGGRVAVEGWAEVSELSALELARRFADAGAAAIVYTDIDRDGALQGANVRSEEHTSELQSLMRISYAVFCLKKNTQTPTNTHTNNTQQ